MLDTRCTNTTSCNACRTPRCISRIITALAIVLSLIVGVILGFLFVGFIGMAIIPLIIFAFGLLLAIILLLLSARCDCRSAN